MYFLLHRYIRVYRITRARSLFVWTCSFFPTRLRLLFVITSVVYNALHSNENTTNNNRKLTYVNVGCLTLIVLLQLFRVNCNLAPFVVHEIKSQSVTQNQTLAWVCEFDGIQYFHFLGGLPIVWQTNVLACLFVCCLLLLSCVFNFSVFGFKVVDLTVCFIHHHYTPLHTGTNRHSKRVRKRAIVINLTHTLWWEW